MARETVLEETSDGVLLLTMNRPKQKNAFNAAMWRDMREALSEARADDAVRTVVITGSEGAFTAGQDLGPVVRGGSAPVVERPTCRGDGGRDVADG